MAPVHTHSSVTMGPVNNPLQRFLLNPVLSILLSSTLRTLLALLLLVSCYTCITLSLLVSLPLVVVIPLEVLNVTICLHHWFVMTKRDILKDKPRFGSFVDFILTTAECTLVLYWQRPWTFHYSYNPFEWSQAVQLITITITLISAIYVQAFDKPSGVVTKPFDFYAMTKDSNNPPFYTMISGVAFSHDRHWFVFLLRRFFTIVIALALLAFSFTNLVLEPVQETSMMPQKIYTTREFSGDVSGGNWSIVAFAKSDTFGDVSKLQDAININARWSDTFVPIDSSCPIRNLEPGEIDITTIVSMRTDNTEMVVFDCPFADVLPDLVIIVNFTTLGINATFPANIMFSTVSIVVGLQMNILDIIHHTSPIPLVPDAHLLGGVLLTIREQFKRPGLASLGVFSSKRAFYACTVPFLSPDPSLQVPRDNNTATLRLYLQADYSDWDLSVEYREKSVLGGISAVGGFWTVLNGLFAMIFGTTLLFVFFGSKPLSTFGLIHKIPKFRPVLDDGPDGRYRNLLSEGQSDQGMLDYVHEHFVDLRPFEDNRAFNEKPNSGTTSPDLTSNEMYEQVSTC